MAHVTLGLTQLYQVDVSNNSQRTTLALRDGVVLCCVGANLQNVLRSRLLWCHLLAISDWIIAR